MEDRDGKKHFTIPKTHTSNKDVVITEKADSRNVIELFNEIKSCASEAHFDFRQNCCKSCDTIRNQKFQKLYNERRIKMKKDRDVSERFGFHLITGHDMASNIANNGLQCDQLSFPIEKYLGNPKDGIHLSRRPDILLAWSGTQGLYKFGLLVCKILLGKGYATLPSTSNKQLSAQLHYDYHFCKVQSINKEQLHINDQLANSSIFCYEHDNFDTISRPSQILPIAILWYDLPEKFPFGSISTNTTRTASKKETPRRNGNSNSKKSTMKKKPTNQSIDSTTSESNKPLTSNSTQVTSIIETLQNSVSIESATSSKTKYPNHVMVPYNRLYSSPSVLPSPHVEQTQVNTTPQVSNSRDPRLLKAKREIGSMSSETIPLPRESSNYERSQSTGSLSLNSTKNCSDEPIVITKSSSIIKIPLHSTTLLIDPRLKTLKNTRNIFYLEWQAVKHSLQQQKRLNNYCDPKTGLAPKTTYTPVPFVMREVSIDEYERLLKEDNDINNSYKLHKYSNGIDCSILSVSVIDCLNFGLIESTMDNFACIDLEKHENKVAYEQIEMSNDLTQREKQINSQHIRLRLREKRQRKLQQQFERKNRDKSLSIGSSPLANSKLYLTTGRQLLKKHILSTKSSNTHLPSDLLDFFSCEYKNETRPYVKHLLAEIVGIFIEKYHIKPNEKQGNNDKNLNGIKESLRHDENMNSVVDMDIASPTPQVLCDYDERFPIPMPPLPLLPPSLVLQSLPSLIFNHTLTNEANNMFGNVNYNDSCYNSVGNFKEQYQKNDSIQTNINPIENAACNTDLPEQTIVQNCLEQYESSSSEDSPTNDNHVSSVNSNLPLFQNPLINTDSNTDRSRDEFVRLLTKEAYTLKSTSPSKNQSHHKIVYDYHHYDQSQRTRRRSFNDDDHQKRKISSSDRSNSRQFHSPLSKNKTKPVQSPPKKLSSTRTVTITSNHLKLLSENQSEPPNNSRENENRNHLQDEPALKRIKIDPDSLTSNTIISTTESPSQEIETDVGLKSIVTIPIIDNNIEHQNDIREQRRTVSPNLSVSDETKAKSLHSSSKSKNSRSSSKKDTKVVSKSNKYFKSRRSPPKSNHDRLRRKQSKSNVDKHRHERRRSPDLSNYQHKQYSNQLMDRHDLFNQTSYRSPAIPTYHQRDAYDLVRTDNLHNTQQRQPMHHKRFNYNHQSVSEHSRFSNVNAPSPSASLTNLHYSVSSTRRRSTSPAKSQDRKTNSSYHSNSHLNPYVFGLKSSNTMERLPKFFNRRTMKPFVPYQLEY